MRHFTPLAIWCVVIAVIVWLIASALTPSSKGPAVPGTDDVAADEIAIGDTQAEVTALLTTHEIQHTIVAEDNRKALLYFGWYELTLTDGKVTAKSDIRDLLD